MDEKLATFLEQSWLFVFLISIIFVFIIVLRDLARTTRRIHYWSRLSYYKSLPRVSLTYQHFYRRGELLSVTNMALCQNIRTDLLKFLKLRKGYSEKDIEILLANKEELMNLFKDESVVNFMLDLNTWVETIAPEVKGLKKLVQRFRTFFSEERAVDEEFFIELALVIRNFRKALEV
ncbi:MAG: hypothetical protein ACTSQB_06660 [Candidatus Heimdallarchaeota archaeon]